jgi:hypothetical protein
VINAREIADVPLHERLDVAAVPDSPATRGAARQRGRVAAGRDALGEFLAQSAALPDLEAAVEEQVDEARFVRSQFALRQRMQPQQAQATRERVRERRQQQRVGRTGQEKAAWRPASIDRRLERREEHRRALHFVEHHALGQFRDEANGVGLRRSLRHVIVEAEVRVVPRVADASRQRRRTSCTASGLARRNGSRNRSAPM